MEWAHNYFKVIDLTLFVQGLFSNSYISVKWKYFNQTFKDFSFGSPKMISYVKDDPFLQVSSQEPSMSYKFFFH